MGLLRENVCAKLCKKVKADKGARINLWNKCGGEVTGLKKKKVRGKNTERDTEGSITGIEQ